MKDYPENVFHLNDYYFVFKCIPHLAETKNKFSEFHLSYKYLIQKT